MLTTSQVLDRAADKIERDGWYSRASFFSMGRDRTCVVVAISTCSDTGPFHEALDALAMAISGVPVLENIWRWNDAPGRTKAEVIALLRACAVVERARETQPEPVGAEVAA